MKRAINKTATVLVVIAALAGAAWVCTDSPEAAISVQTVSVQGPEEDHTFSDPCELKSVECENE